MITQVSIDSRNAAAGTLFIPLPGMHADGHAFIEDAFNNSAGAALVQKGHGVIAKLCGRHADRALIEVVDPLRALGDIACCWRSRFAARVIAITGSNGKTSTKEMLWNILSRHMPCIKNPGNFNNLIGLPLSLLPLDGSQQAAILEMGMSERGEISRLAEISRPQIGLITNVGPAHLAQLKNLEEIAEAKGELFSYLSGESTAVVNRDDARVVARAKTTRAHIISYGLDGGDVHASNLRCCAGSGTAFDLHIMGESTTVQLRIPGRHFVSNALAAAATAHSLGMSMEQIKAGLEAYTGVPGRMELVRLGGITILNDAYNANPVSMTAALTALSMLTPGNHRIAVLGDMLELGEQSRHYHKELGKTVAGLPIDYLFYTGEFSSDVREGALAAGMPGAHLFLSDTLEALTDILQEKLCAGDALLLKGSRKMNMERVIDLLKIRTEC